MKKLSKIANAFFELVRAGLWTDVESKDLGELGFIESVDWEKVYQLAEEQSVVGLVLQGIERLKNATPHFNLNQELLLQWIGEVQSLEQQNKSMNLFVANLIEKMRKVDIYALLVKCQGIAQCYERPLWRAPGDVDLLLSRDNYQKAKSFLTPFSSSVENENTKVQHLGFTIQDWTVEIHGSMRSRCLSKMDKIIEEVQNDIFYGGNVRSWQNGNTVVFLPSPDVDVILVFTHILKHFFRSGIGLRQICDWCRLLWSYKDSLNYGLLETRIRKAGLMSEWRSFAALAVDYLGMPQDAMPLYSSKIKWQRKANHVISYILEVGNFGHNRDQSYYSNEPFLTRKIISLRRRFSDFANHFFIFPIDSLKVLLRTLLNGVLAVIKYNEK